MSSARRWLVGGAAAAAAVALLAPTGVPLYDGVANPDEPYRYVAPTADAKTTKQPTTAQTTLRVRGGRFAGGYANSDETGPQISVYVPPGSLQVPAGATSIQITATPLAPRPPLPTDGRIVTNVYRVTAEADGKPLAVVGTGASAPSIQMRAPDGSQPTPVFERRTANGWQRLATARQGFDVFQATSVTALGEFALVRPAHTSSGGGGINLGLLAGGLAVLALVAVIFFIRLRRTSG